MDAPVRHAHPADAAHAADRFAPASRPVCPLCHGPMWDNRATKRTPAAPDFKCRDRTCGGRLWPERADSISATLERRQPDGTLPIRGRVARETATGTPAPTPKPAAATSDAGMSHDTARAHFRTRAELRACYATATDFVLSQIVPRYTAAGLTVSDQAVAQIVATLFAATCARGAVAGSAPRADAAHLATGDEA